MPVDPTPIELRDCGKVFKTSIASNSMVISLLENSLGGIIWLTYPWLSWVNVVFLYPSDTKAVAPKLEFELVNEISPPDSVTNCSA